MLEEGDVVIVCIICLLYVCISIFVFFFFFLSVYLLAHALNKKSLEKKTRPLQKEISFSVSEKETGGP